MTMKVTAKAPTTNWGRTVSWRSDISLIGSLWNRITLSLITVILINGVAQVSVIL